MYPYNMHTGHSFHEAHTATAIRGWIPIPWLGVTNQLTFSESNSLLSSTTRPSQFRMFWLWTLWETSWLPLCWVWSSNDLNCARKSKKVDDSSMYQLVGPKIVYTERLVASRHISRNKHFCAVGTITRAFACLGFCCTFWAFSLVVSCMFCFAVFKLWVFRPATTLHYRLGLIFICVAVSPHENLGLAGSGLFWPRRNIMIGFWKKLFSTRGMPGRQSGHGKEIPQANTYTRRWGSMEWMANGPFVEEVLSVATLLWGIRQLWGNHCN